MEHSSVNLFDMPVAVLFYLTSLLELCYLLRNLKIKDLQQRDCNKLIVSSVQSHLILIQKFDISVLDIHKEWKDRISNDQTESDHTLSDHTDNVVPNDVKSVKWSDELGGSLTDIHTYTISPTEIHQKRLNARTIRKQRKQRYQVGPETLFLNPLF